MGNGEREMGEDEGLNTDFEYRFFLFFWFVNILSIYKGKSEIYNENWTIFYFALFISKLMLGEFRVGVSIPVVQLGF